MPKMANNLAKRLVDLAGLSLQLDGPVGRVGSHFDCLELLECDIVWSGQTVAPCSILAIWAAPSWRTGKISTNVGQSGNHIFPDGSRIAQNNLFEGAANSFNEVRH